MGISGIPGEFDPLKVEWQSTSRSNGSMRQLSEPAEEGDQVSISGDMQDLMRIRKLVDEAPDIRRGRIEQLRNEIARGTYNVSSSEIAAAVIREHSFDPSGV